MLHYAVLPLANVLAAANSNVLELRPPVAASTLARADVLTEVANASGDLVFDILLNGASIFAAPEDRLTLEAGDTEGFAALDVATVRGDRLQIDATAVPAGGFAANRITIILTFDDGIATVLAGDVTGAFGANTVTKVRGLAFANVGNHSRSVWKWNPLAQQFEQSDPILTRDDIIYDLYYGALGRVPDSAELDAARNTLLTGFNAGAVQYIEAIRTVGFALFTGAEHDGLAKTDAEFVAGLYRGYLGREPEPAGLAAWLAALASSNRDAIADTFSRASEFTTLRVPFIYGATIAGAPQRQTTVKITGSLANEATENTTVTLAKTACVLYVTADRACRLRVYSTAAHRTADAARPVGADADEHSPVLEFVFDATLLRIDASDGINVHNSESSYSDALPVAIQNLSGATAAVTLTFVFVPMES